MVFTACDDVPGYVIKFHTVNRYHADDKFPHCFDVTSLSRPRFGLQHMGFSRIVEITAARNTMPPGWADKHLCLLGIRKTKLLITVPPRPRTMNFTAGTCGYNIWSMRLAAASISLIGDPSRVRFSAPRYGRNTQIESLHAENPFRYCTLFMDLRPLITSKKQIEEARRLALRGLLSYQPYIFSDDFATGAGLSILAGHLTEPPAVYCKDATANDTDPAFFAREFAKENQREEFFAANKSMRRFYDGMVDQIANAVGPLDDMSVLDVGCNTGYFPLAFARRGARQAKGIDRIDYSPTVALLNDICGTSVQFANWNYDGSLTAPEQYDLVLSVAVLVHLSEPLRHLAWLGSSARKALMVFTPFHRATQYAALRQSPLLDPGDQSASRVSAPECGT